ncbi:Uncharacterized protein SCF082_LOCUS29539 [Durusdinium trenchii]|uniref:Uncharacterized protein n=2 Tax=Durusdinium trenchii TaxID=1381693 RepID=A0ABP0MSF1_9DINO
MVETRGGSALLAPKEDGRLDFREAGARDGMEQYVGVGQAKAWLLQNEEALPSQRSSSKSLDSSRLQRSSRSPKRPGHSLVVPVALPPDLPESEGVVKPHRSTALKLLEGGPPEGIETSESFIDVPAKQPVYRAVTGMETGSPLARMLNRQRREWDCACETRGLAPAHSTPAFDKIEREGSVRVLQASPTSTRRTLHPAIWGSPREAAPPRLYWPTMNGRSHEHGDVGSKHPIRLLSPAVSRRSVEPVALPDQTSESVAKAVFSVSPPMSCRSGLGVAESWNPPRGRAIPQPDFSWQPGKLRDPSVEKVRLVDEEVPKVTARTSVTSLVPEVVPPVSRATLGSLSCDRKKIAFTPSWSRSTLTPQRPQVLAQDVSVTPPIRSHFPPAVYRESEPTTIKRPAVVVRCVRSPILLHASHVPVPMRALRIPDNARPVREVK